ncbi:MAG TPA: GAF domain-containing protein [Marmoricola sp.]|nr:GAF domain-containing protein [Marmoricola sp.]
MTPEEEQRRLEAVRGLHQLDSGPEERFDRIAELARQIFGVPMVGINLVEEDRQFAKAGIGLQHVMARRDAFSTQTIEGHGQLLVQDARTDPRFADDPYVRGDPHIRFYAGQPVKAHGETVGALCILDHEPRELSTAESRLLRTLGRWVENELALDHEVLQAREVQRRLLPRSVPDVPGLELAGRCRPAREVGGDFYDHQVLDDGTVQVAIADVMGKGLTAAVIAAGTRAVLRGHLPLQPLARGRQQDGADDAGGPRGQHHLRHPVRRPGRPGER